eukprot:scaffold49887_cov71-Cyclotella_meneghiniana.AAC.3
MQDRSEEVEDGMMFHVSSVVAFSKFAASSLAVIKIPLPTVSSDCKPAETVGSGILKLAFPVAANLLKANTDDTWNYNFLEGSPHVRS